MKNVLILCVLFLTSAFSTYAAVDCYSLTAKKIDRTTLRFKDLKGKKLMIVVPFPARPRAEMKTASSRGA